MSSNVKDEEEESHSMLLADKSHEDTILQIDENENPAAQGNTEKKQRKNRGNQTQKQGASLRKTALHLAAEVGDAETLRELVVKNPKDTGRVDESCRTPLHLAAKSFHYDCCQILLDTSKKEINLTDKAGDTPLMLSISSGNISYNTTKLLISYDAKLSTGNKGKRTALHIAAEKGNTETLKLLLKKDKSTLDNVDTEKQTPLHLAARNGHIQVCKELLSAGANKQARDINSYTPLHWASKMGFEKCISILIANKCDVNCTDKARNTPLHLLCASGKDKGECAEELLANGADFNAQNSKGETPFHLAQNSSHDVRKAFQSLPLDLLLKDNKGRTVLHCAAERSKTNARLDLILSMDQLRQMETEKFVNMLDNEGKTALHIAVMGNRYETCKLLVKAGADGNISCGTKGTALHLAAEKGFDDICDFLIAKKVNVNIRNNESLTPLHLAAKNGHSKCCDVLIRKGALVADADNDGNTVLHHAAKGDHPECCELLLKNNVPLVNKVNREGKTPLHVAVENHSLECCKKLVTKKTDLWASGLKEIPSPVRLAFDQGYKDIFTYFMQNCSLDNVNQSNKDIDFRDFLEKVLLSSDSETVESIIRSCYWEESLQPYDREGKQAEFKKNNNMRLLVEKYPSLAEEVFDKCLPSEEENSNEDSTKDKLRRYTFFYIDEMFVKSDTVDKESSSRDKTRFKYETFFHPNYGRLLRSVKAFHTNQKWRENHVLSCAIREGHHFLFTHPLTISWIRYKWHYIRWIKNFFVFLSLVIAMLLTTFSLEAWSWQAFHERWHINQSSVCSSEKDLVGPEVFPYLMEEAKMPNKITYAIAGLLSFWLLHEIYKLITLRKRYGSNATVAWVVTVVCSVLFLGNFTHCSQLTQIREDWQWIAGYVAIGSSWVLTYYLFSIHPTRPPIFNFGNLWAAAVKVFIPEVPIIIAVIAIYVMIPNGSMALNHFLEILKNVYGNLPSLGALIIIILIVLVLFRMFRNRNSILDQKVKEQCSVASVSMILNYELLYPCLRRFFYRAWLTVDEDHKFVGFLTSLKCCRSSKRSIIFENKSKRLPQVNGTRQKIETLLTNIQADLDELKIHLSKK